MLLWFSWLITKPARKLQRAAETVLKGEFKEDPNLELGPKEFVKTGITFNQMVHSINQMISSNQRLLSDISHELRSPLTRLKMANALAKRKTGNSSELQRIEVESERLENMINDLLHLSKLKLESHQNKGVVDLFELYGDILNDAKYESKNMNKLLTFNQMPKVLLKVNIPLIQSALENVIRNAIKYANKNINILFLKKETSLI
ncbi:histidine kinase dimerization/phospho-acceptor domain-containing protein [Paraphotobacterium marinum]|nr:histidine kinase dimerization/phospho-acceptor domain-containing protein [Paraphotobacterium marinum]